MKLSNKTLFSAAAALFTLISCGSDNNFVPKPHAYPRMALPQKSYKPFPVSDAPFSFEIPTYATVQEDTLNPGKHWYNMKFPSLDVTLHLTYHRFNSWEGYDSMIADTRTLVNKHIQKAEDIVEDPVENYNPKIHGVLFHIQGNTASNLNFYTTDSAKHFVRGALYFDKKTENDSIRPVFEFLQDDIYHAIKTFQWKN
jgi:gliding motility-associated lipoprotein GldD